MTVYVILEDLALIPESDVIGVVSSLDKVPTMLKAYYGDYIVKAHNDIRDSDVEYRDLIEFDGLCGKKEQCDITVMSFRVDEL